LPARVREGGDEAALARLREPEQATAAAFAMELARDPALGGDGWDTVHDHRGEQRA